MMTSIAIVSFNHNGMRFSNDVVIFRQYLCKSIPPQEKPGAPEKIRTPNLLIRSLKFLFLVYFDKTTSCDNLCENIFLNSHQIIIKRNYFT